MFLIGIQKDVSPVFLLALLAPQASVLLASSLPMAMTEKALGQVNLCIQNNQSLIVLTLNKIPNYANVKFSVLVDCHWRPR